MGRDAGYRLTACASARTSLSTDLRFPTRWTDPGGCRPWGADADTGLLPVHPHELFHQLILGFTLYGWIGDAAHGAGCRRLRLCIRTNFSIS